MYLPDSADHERIGVACGMRSPSLVSPWLAVILATCATGGCGARSDLEGGPLEQARSGDCGDHAPDSAEECDDGNTSDADACLTICKLASCGDGAVRTGFEACDDGNAVDSDGCRNNCSLPSCGDGVVEAGEECDDGNSFDDDACPATCIAARCGDGFVQTGVESCDLGSANEDRPALWLTQAGLEAGVRPVQAAAGVVAFYGYDSASAHTGFEELGASRLFAYQDTTQSSLSLVTIHGIDIDSSAVDQPKGRVGQRFSFLPPGVAVAFSDEDSGELWMASASVAVGDWTFHHNTDGGVLSAFPFPGSWSIDVESDFIEGIGAWSFIDPSGEIDITLDDVAHLTAFDSPSACRLDCTIPSCGDNVLDGGEICDDGNAVGGDGCSADCKSLE